MFPFPNPREEALPPAVRPLNRSVRSDCPRCAELEEALKEFELNIESVAEALTRARETLAERLLELGNPL